MTVGELIKVLKTQNSTNEVVVKLSYEEDSFPISKVTANQVIWEDENEDNSIDDKTEVKLIIYN